MQTLLILDCITFKGIYSISIKRIIIFGGKGDKGKVFRDLHALDPVTIASVKGGLDRILGF